MAIVFFIAFVAALFFAVCASVEIKSGDKRIAMRTMFAISSFFTVYSLVTLI